MLAAVTAWINARLLRLPMPVGVMVLALVTSGGVVLFDGLGIAPPGLRDRTRELLVELDFGHALLDVMLAFLLFAGALHVTVAGRPARRPRTGADDDLRGGRLLDRGTGAHHRPTGRPRAADRARRRRRARPLNGRAPDAGLPCRDCGAGRARVSRGGLRVARG